MRPPQPIAAGRLYRGPAILLALIVLLPLCARGPYSYLVPLMQLCGIYAIIVTGLTLLMGFCGQISLGHAAFYGLGAYVGAVVVTAAKAPLWVAIPASLLAVGALSFVVGLSILRLRGHTLALATLCIGVILSEGITKTEITGGAAGLYDLPALNPFGILTGHPLGKVYFIWAVVWLVVLWAVHLTESPVGRALRAIHGDEAAAESLGVPTFAVKVKVFTASGVLAALAGVLYAFVYTPSYLGPEEFGLMFSVSLVTMVVIGGMGSVWGGLAGSVALIGLREGITLLGERAGSTDAAKYEQLVFGLLLVGVMICSRDGLMPAVRRAVGRRRKLE